MAGTASLNVIVPGSTTVCCTPVGNKNGLVTTPAFACAIAEGALLGALLFALLLLLELFFDDFEDFDDFDDFLDGLLYTSPSPRDQRGSRMPSSA